MGTSRCIRPARKLQHPLLTVSPLTTDGFFDAGMLLQALKARGGNGLDAPETSKSSERAAVQARRRDVGKKLRLIDY